MANSSLTPASGDLPATRWTLISRLRSMDAQGKQQALETLCRQYHYPLYCFLRRRGLGHHDSQDVLQDFLAKALRLDMFEKADQEKGRLRTLLLVSLQRHLNSWIAREKRQPRRLEDHKTEFQNDLERYEQDSFSETESPGAVYDRKWTQELLARALDRLRTRYIAAGKAAQIHALWPVLLAGGSLKDADPPALAAALGISVNALRVTLNRLLKDYRKTLREEIADTVDSAAAVEEELADLRQMFNSP